MAPLEVDKQGEEEVCLDNTQRSTTPIVRRIRREFRRDFEAMCSNKDLCVIDVATGTGRGALAFSNYSQVSQIVATDVDAQMIKAKIAGDSGEFRGRESGERFEVLSSEEKGQFDVATVFQAFHWFDAQKVLKELRENVLKDGGILAVAVRIFLRVLPFLIHSLTHTYSGTIAT